jgi:enoyl-CoA hydratase/3-hydroxyacyl-CoA dehydrogenase
MKATDARTIVVLGTRSMGHGIAAVTALAEHNVKLSDTSEEYVQAGYEKIEWSVGKLSKPGQISGDKATKTLRRIDVFVGSKDSLSNVDFVIAAVSEQTIVTTETIYIPTAPHSCGCVCNGFQWLLECATESADDLP